MQNENTLQRLTRKLIAISTRYLKNAFKERCKYNKSPEAMAKLFWGQVIIGAPDDCWPWVGRCTLPGGYGQISAMGRTHPALRFAHELTNGKPDYSKKCCHKCDNPPCCNPKHAFMGTVSENILDSVKKGRYNRRRGEAIHLAKLRDEDIPEIRRLFASGINKCEIGRRFGVSDVTIYAIIKGITWRHI